MKTLLPIICLILAISSCRNTEKNDKPTITVTIEPLRYFTEAIAGDKFNVVSMVPEGSSPETYDPTPQQMVNLSKSKAYMRIGYIGFEQTWIGKLQRSLPKLQFYDTSAGINLIHQQCSHSHEENTSKGHEHGIEPHIWNSAGNAKIIANNIYNALEELDKGNSEYYKSKLDSLTRIIDETDKEIRSIITKADKTFLIYHPALTYFARDYGLEQISIEEGGKEPSPAHLQSLIKLCKEKNAKIIFVQQEFDMRNAETIAKELGLEVVTINPLNYQWVEEMINTAEALHTKNDTTENNEQKHN